MNLATQVTELENSRFQGGVRIIKLLAEKIRRMSERVPCKTCDAEILPDTAEKTGGYCLRCSKDLFGDESGAEINNDKSDDQELTQGARVSYFVLLIILATVSLYPIGLAAIIGLARPYPSFSFPVIILSFIMAIAWLHSIKSTFRIMSWILAALLFLNIAGCTKIWGNFANVH